MWPICYTKNKYIVLTLHDAVQNTTLPERLLVSNVNIYQLNSGISMTHITIAV